MLNRFCSWARLVIFLAMIFVGCNSGEHAPISVEHAPISIEVAKGIKSGTSLEDIKKILGEPHAPSSIQANHLSGMIGKMPEPMRTNASKDKSIAWGNDAEFLVAKVNDKEIVWVTARRSGSPK